MLLNSSAFCAIMMKGFELMLAEVSRGPARAATVEERMTKQLRIHIQGKKHQKQLNKVGPGGGGGGQDKMFQCSVCNITTTDQNGLTNHLNGKSHQAMLKKGGFRR